MKKLLSFSILTVLIALVFSSCSSGWSFTKRKYTKGYYVSKSHKQQQPKEHAVAQNNAGAKTGLTDQHPTLAPVNVSPLPTTTDKEPKSDNLQANATTATRKTEHRKQTSAEKSPVGFPSIELKKPVKTVENAIRQHKLSAGDSEGLSLFWIVILIILILWALGLISGNFGAVVNVLLIVALILLILWLLRIL